MCRLRGEFLVKRHAYLLILPETTFLFLCIIFACIYLAPRVLREMGVLIRA